MNPIDASFTPDPRRRGPDDETARDEFLQAHPPEAFLAEVDALRAGRRAPWFRPLAVSLAAAGLAVAVVTVGVPSPDDGARSKGNATVDTNRTATGEAALGFVVKRADRQQAGADGQVCRAGDQLRLLATQQAWSYGLAFSVDAAGHVEPLLVGPDGKSLPLARGRDLPLPGGRELDDYVGPEWYWLIVSERPLELAASAAEARRSVLDHVARGGRPADLELTVEEGARALGFWIVNSCFV